MKHRRLNDGAIRTQTSNEHRSTFHKNTENLTNFGFAYDEMQPLYKALKYNLR
jgi:hypothetical protein